MKNLNTIDSLIQIINFCVESEVVLLKFSWKVLITSPEECERYTDESKCNALSYEVTNFVSRHLLSFSSVEIYFVKEDLEISNISRNLVTIIKLIGRKLSSSDCDNKILIIINIMLDI